MSTANPTGADPTGHAPSTAPAPTAGRSQASQARPVSAEATPSDAKGLQPPEGLFELPKAYSPAETEAAITARWNDSGAFHVDPTAKAPPFCIVIPPPNVTAALHLGHALNNTLQDVLVRVHRMRGFKTLWMPGTDHAGIATQAVVEKRLLQEGKRRTDFTREQFVATVQSWKDEYEATILAQLAAMGCSCDWPRTRFTMDPVCAAAVREAFFLLFRDGLIYRGKRLVNWDPATQTALADDEVEMEEVDGHMWYLRYPLVEAEGGDSGSTPTHVTVATTRPETMLGDTAVAVNPRDPRAAALRGRRVRLPIVGREIPIVEDDYVVLPVELGGDPADPKSAVATGFLKVTPAHDPNDWEIGRRHGLDVINVLAPDGTISDRHGWTDIGPEARAFVGLTREQARERVVQWFEEHGLLEAVKPYRHGVGHSYRSHVPIEPYLSDQWYVRVTDDRLRGAALRAMAPDQRAGVHAADAGPRASGDGELRFWPARYARTFELWHENLRDWCISRQLWWGHRISVWSAPAERVDATIGSRISDWSAAGRSARQDSETETHVCVRDPEGADAEIVRELEAAGFTRDPDVLDTWFSSALWPISTMGWPRPEEFPREIPEGSALLEAFNPSTVLCTAREIITLWVSRMVMFNRVFRDGRLPFTQVFIHAMIQDGNGQKMSKSLGNGVDPRDIIHSHGADALRFVLTQMATNTQDVRLGVDMVDPHSGEVFAPRLFKDESGHLVAEPIQTSPRYPDRKMCSGYGVATGKVVPTAEMPLARNTSSRFDLGRNFCNKLWNAARFALGSLSAAPHEGAGPDAAAAAPPEGPPTSWTPERLVDRWMATRLERTLAAVEGAVAEFQFNVYADAMYDLVWRDFCDWYLEAAKPTVRGDRRQQQVLLTALDAILRLLHPICPFVTEALWPHVRAAGPAGLAGIELPPSDLLATAAWPRIELVDSDAEAAAPFERVQALVGAIRNLRGERKVQPRRRIRLHAPAAVAALVNQADGVVETLAGLEAVEALDPRTAPDARPAGAIPLAFEGHELLLSGLVDAVDVAAERARLEKLVAELEGAIRGFRGKLDNPGYVSKAPPAVVEETRRKLAKAEADLAAANAALAAL